MRVRMRAASSLAMKRMYCQAARRTAGSRTVALMPRKSSELSWAAWIPPGAARQSEAILPFFWDREPLRILVELVPIPRRPVGVQARLPEEVCPVEEDRLVEVDRDALDVAVVRNGGHHHVRKVLGDGARI